jgi:protoheme IX farnesyltransferase
MSTVALVSRRAVAADYLELTKPRITLLVVFTTLVGFVVAAPGALHALPLLAVLAGTTLVAAGASVVNMVLERDTDALMHRTRARPIPAGRVRALDALLFGLVLTSLGLALLSWRSGALPAAVALATWLSYLFAYTPLKRRTSLSTLVGAVPGALPPVIGWAAARQSLDGGAFVLFAILFLWQIPHFLAIAWIYREDYARAGLPMLPVLDPAGGLTGRQAVIHSLALLLVSLTPVAAGFGGPYYMAGAVLLGIGMTLAAFRLAVLRTVPAARALFLASVLYLPALLALLLWRR